MRFNNFYSYMYIVCECLNVAVLVFNFFWTNWFLGDNEFLNYGPEAVAHSNLESTDFSTISPQDRVFPKVSKCDFQKYGPSGGLIRSVKNSFFFSYWTFQKSFSLFILFTRYDIMCVLAINIINEKIYVFLW